MTKQSKAEVHYTETSTKPRERCEWCSMYEGLGSCSEVLGGISVAGWCELFAERDKGPLRFHRGASS